MTWFIMLENYIHERENDVDIIKEKYNKNPTGNVDSERAYIAGTGKLMRYTLYFLKEGHFQKTSPNILVPSNRLVDDLRNKYIPRLIDIV